MWWINRTAVSLSERLNRLLLPFKSQRILPISTERNCYKCYCPLTKKSFSKLTSSTRKNSKSINCSSSIGYDNLLQKRFSCVRFSTQGKDSASEKTTFLSQYIHTWRKNPLPIWMGLLLIAALQFRRRRKEQIQTESSHTEPVEAQPVAQWIVQAYEQMPLDILSRLVGYILNDITLPEWLREPIISWYANAFQCRIYEAEKGDKWQEYKSVGEFFRRRLKEDARPIDQNAILTSPCDGRVLSCGPIEASGKLEQVKGASYMLKDFLGNYTDTLTEPRETNSTNTSETVKYVPKKNTQLYQCTLYLAPGDYHCFHAPADWTVKLRRHFTGKLLSVGPSVMGKIPHLMSLNERVVYFGEWCPDTKSTSDDVYFFSFAAVGATNVGSIKIDIDNDLKTNPKGKFKKNRTVDEQFFNSSDDKNHILKGAYFGEFNLGSSIVIVIEAPLDFSFDVQFGEKVFVGQPLAKGKK